MKIKTTAIAFSISTVDDVKTNSSSKDQTGVQIESLNQIHSKLSSALTLTYNIGFSNKLKDIKHTIL